MRENARADDPGSAVIPHGRLLRGQGHREVFTRAAPAFVLAADMSANRRNAGLFSSHCRRERLVSWVNRDFSGAAGRASILPAAHLLRIPIEGRKSPLSNLLKTAGNHRHGRFQP
jgi:hypothetical protein